MKPAPRAAGAGGRRPSRRHAVALAALFALAAPPSPAAARAEAPPGAAARRPSKELGIRITALRLTAAGYMVDVRYRVRHPERAKAFLARSSGELYLLDEATGMRLAVPTTPKLGPLRQGVRGQPRTDREYFVLFANPGRRLQRGDRVTLVAGDARIRHLAVE